MSKINAILAPVCLGELPTDGALTGAHRPHEKDVSPLGHAVSYREK
jgi:hypothetical protein